MYLLCSTLCYARQPLDVALERIAELEFAGVELGVLRRGGAHPVLAEIIEQPTEAADRLKRISPLPVRAVYADFPVNGEGPHDAAFRSLVRFTHGVRATLLTIPAASSEASIEQEAERLRRYALLAAEEGITLCVEFRRGTLAGTLEGVAELHRAAPHVWLTLDVGDFVASGYDLKGGEAIYPLVQHVHLRDAAPDSPSEPLGRGNVDYSRLLSHLERQGFRRGLSVEYVDEPPLPFEVHPEVRKLKLLMETLT